MGFFTGPSDHVLLTTARGIAFEIAGLRLLRVTEDPHDDLDHSIRRDRTEQGLPNSVDEAARIAACVIQEYGLGWYKRNRFLGMFEGSLRALGLPLHDARYIKNLVEIYYHRKTPVEPASVDTEKVSHPRLTIKQCGADTGQSEAADGRVRAPDAGTKHDLAVGGSRPRNREWLLLVVLLAIAFVAFFAIVFIDGVQPPVRVTSEGRDVISEAVSRSETQVQTEIAPETPPSSHPNEQTQAYLTNILDALDPNFGRTVDWRLPLPETEDDAISQAIILGLLFKVFRGRIRDLDKELVARASTFGPERIDAALRYRNAYQENFSEFWRPIARRTITALSPGVLRDDLEWIHNDMFIIFSIGEFVLEQELGLL